MGAVFWGFDFNRDNKAATKRLVTSIFYIIGNWTSLEPDRYI